jgi:CheY-like chemotaxis protein
MVSGREIRVLVVDDHRDSANALGLLLREYGFSARIAYSGRQAIQFAPAFRPHVVILDLMMPGLDGFQAIAQLQRQDCAPDAIYIAYTGVSAPNVASLVQRAGFHHYLVKPVHFRSLHAILATVRVGYADMLLQRAANSVSQSERLFQSNRLEKFLDDVQRTKERSVEHMTTARASIRALESAVNTVDSRYVLGRRITT